jgi:hypothetical protein
MTAKRLLGGAALAIALGVGAWQGIEAMRAPTVPSPGPTAASAVEEGTESTSDIVTIDVPQAAVSEAGATPMAERVAVVGLLNKRNGESRDITLRPGQAVRVGDAIVRLRACEKTAPWEPQELTGAFVQLDVRQSDQSWRRVFSGWLYKERPALNVVQHPIYDVWTKSCKMSRPDSGPERVSLSSVRSGGASDSSAKKSGGDDDAADENAAPEAAATPDAAAVRPAPASSPSAEANSAR